MTPSVLQPPETPERIRARREGGDPPPGGDGGGDGDDGGQGGASGGEDGARRLGVTLALVAISSLFIVFLALFAALRHRAAVWPPAGTPPPPAALWTSTALLALSSYAVVRAASAATRGLGPELARWLEATILLGLGFLLSQCAIWLELGRAGLLPRSGSYGALFYALTGLHALHVLGGLLLLGQLRTRAARLAVDAGGATVRLAGTYWHFMGLLWTAVLLLIWAPGGNQRMKELEESGVKTLLVIILGGVFAGFGILVWILFSGQM